jgi:hypothetical protein
LGKEGGMKRPNTAHLNRSLALLEFAKSKAEAVRIRWRSKDLGSWESVNPHWWVSEEKIWLQFRNESNLTGMWITAMKPKPWGVHILLSNPKDPIPGLLELAWESSMQDAVSDFSDLWAIVRYWLARKFPLHRIVKAKKRSDRAQTFSNAFLRVHFRHAGKDCCLIAADAGDAAHLAVSQGLLWISALVSRNAHKHIPKLYILLPSGFASVAVHRCQYLNRVRAKMEVWEYTKGSTANPELKRVVDPPAPEENRDYRWPVLGPFRWSSQLERVLNLAPDLIRRYPRFQDYDSLRLWGLEFAQVAGSERERVFFGIGPQRIELTEDNFDSLQSLIREILYYRRPDSPDTLHPYYRLQSERWLEALILEDVARLFPEMSPESVYSQIPAYLGKDPGRVDILGANRQGALVVMELKVHPDSDLPLQALDYWGRVIQHSRNGDFVRRGYFSEVLLNRQRPQIYLVSPIFSFHDSTESLLHYFDSDLEVWKIAINMDWRCGVKIMRRIRYLGKNL